MENNEQSTMMMMIWMTRMESMAAIERGGYEGGGGTRYSGRNVRDKSVVGTVQGVASLIAVVWMNGRP